MARLITFMYDIARGRAGELECAHVELAVSAVVICRRGHDHLQRLVVLRVIDGQQVGIEPDC